MIPFAAYDVLRLRAAQSTTRTTSSGAARSVPPHPLTLQPQPAVQVTCRGGAGKINAQIAGLMDACPRDGPPAACPDFIQRAWTRWLARPDFRGPSSSALSARQCWPSRPDPPHATSPVQSAALPALPPCAIAETGDSSPGTAVNGRGDGAPAGV